MGPRGLASIAPIRHRRAPIPIQRGQLHHPRSISPWKEVGKAGRRLGHYWATASRESNATSALQREADDGSRTRDLRLGKPLEPCVVIGPVRESGLIKQNHLGTRGPVLVAVGSHFVCTKGGPNRGVVAGF
jgi:hypothetical protein